MLYVECEHLTEEERKIRHDLIYIFNPCLKFLFNKKGHFKEYAYNSCRQTAIFTAVFLLQKMPGYKISAYEGKFTDILHNQHVDYEHAFVVAEKSGRKILVDISRTERKLLFQTINDLIYPTVEGYENCKLISYEKMDFCSLILTLESEYLTELQPSIVMSRALDKFEEIKGKTKSEQLNFAEKIYNQTTKIGGEFI